MIKTSKKDLIIGLLLFILYSTGKLSSITVKVLKYFVKFALLYEAGMPVKTIKKEQK
jgi:hypothetical protein